MVGGVWWVVAVAVVMVLVVLMMVAAATPTAAAADILAGLFDECSQLISLEPTTQRQPLPCHQRAGRCLATFSCQIVSASFQSANNPCNEQAS